VLALGSGVCMRSGQRLAADGDGHRRTVLITCGEAPHPQRSLARELLPLAMPAEQHGAVAVAGVAAGVLASTRGEGRGRRGRTQGAHASSPNLARRVTNRAGGRTRSPNLASILHFLVGDPEPFLLFSSRRWHPPSLVAS
jgi:hypothetical protein